MKASVVIAAVVVMHFAAQLHAATITVTTTADSGPGSLRDALANAGDGDTIDASVVSGTILLTTGELLVTNSVDIIGSGPDMLAIDGNAASRVFHIGPSNTVSISSLTITNGSASGDPPAGVGGGIYNDHSTLIVSNCMVSGSSATFYGGGIDNNGADGTASAQIVNSTLSSNSVVSSSGSRLGGGIYNDRATLAINNCFLSNNIARVGGGIYNHSESGGTASVQIVNSTLSGNRSRGDVGGGVFNGTSFPSPFGGGIATMLITNSILSGNSAETGGGIFNVGASGTSTVKIVNSTLIGNSATVSGGGGVYNELYHGSGVIIPGVASVEIRDSSLSSNSANRHGGGVVNDSADLLIVNSTLSDNIAFLAGGGVQNIASFRRGLGTAVIVNSTLSGNVGGRGAAIWNIAEQGGVSLKIVNSTLSSNSAIGQGGVSVYNEVHPPLSIATMEIGSTIMNAVASGANITNVLGTVTSLGYNLSSDDGGGFLTATGDQTNTDPMLGPLQDNGGPTFTHALLPGSPAINAGDPNFTPPPDFDQRGPGFPRVACGRIDIGAFEVQGGVPVITCPSNLVVNAISPKGAFVSFAPTASDDCSTASVTSTPPSGSRFSIGDTIVSCTATDAAGNQATCRFTVHVKGAAEQIDDLISLVRDLNLKPGAMNSLLAKLQAASSALRRGNTRAACGNLDAFIFEVDVQIWLRRIQPAGDGHLLIRKARRIRAVLSCSNGFNRGRD